MKDYKINWLLPTHTHHKSIDIQLLLASNQIRHMNYLVPLQYGQHYNVLPLEVSLKHSYTSTNHYRFSALLRVYNLYSVCIMVHSQYMLEMYTGMQAYTIHRLRMLDVSIHIFGIHPLGVNGALWICLVH